MQLIESQIEAQLFVCWQFKQRGKSWATWSTTFLWIWLLLVRTHWTKYGNTVFQCFPHIYFTLVTLSFSGCEIPTAPGQVHSHSVGNDELLKWKKIEPSPTKSICMCMTWTDRYCPPHCILPALLPATIVKVGIEHKSWGEDSNNTDGPSSKTPDKPPFKSWFMCLTTTHLHVPS